jgi:hypothetical protein
MRKCLAILFLLPVFTNPAIGQQDNILFFMQGLPQSNIVNPAVQSSCKWFIGVPILSSVHFNYSNTAFTYNQLLSVHPLHDTTEINLKYIADHAHRMDMISSEFHLNWISLGYLYKNYYFTFNISEKIDVSVFWPKELVQLIWKGNIPFIGKTAHASGTRANADYYREYAFGVSKVINNKLTLGAKAKLLFGKADVYTSKSASGLYTSSPEWNLHLNSNVTVKESLPVTIETDANGKISSITVNEINPVKFLLNPQNKGFAFDFGYIYKYDDKTTLSGSLLDLGLIRWKSDAAILTENGQFVWQGTGLNSNFNSANYASQLYDSITNAFNLSSKPGFYFSYLAPKIYIGGTYALNKKVDFGVLNRNEIFWNKMHSSLTVSANTYFYKFLTASAGWSYINHSVNNIGIGLGLKAPNFIFHIISDNALGFFDYKNTRNINLRFGFNFVFGCKEAEEDDSGYMKSPGCVDWSKKWPERHISNKLPFKR